MDVRNKCYPKMTAVIHVINLSQQFTPYLVNNINIFNTTLPF